jgi:hypothetical protein
MGYETQCRVVSHLNDGERCETGVRDTAIFAAAVAAGLTYTKVVRFSDTHTGEKLVIPRSARK